MSAIPYVCKPAELPKRALACFASERNSRHVTSLEIGVVRCGALGLIVRAEHNDFPAVNNKTSTAMTTPTASHPPQPSSASKKSTGHATPLLLGLSSPAPRSVPSPAAARKDQAGKTPINHPTTGSSQGSKTLGGTPMVHNPSQHGIAGGPSPGVNTLMYGTPIGLGVEGITPSVLNLPTPIIGGLTMTTSLSELGLTSSLGGSKPNEDEQRKTRMRKILKGIGVRKGRVSEEGIARVSRRVGFTNDIDVEKLSRDQQERIVGNRKIAIAGNKVLVEVDLKNHVPQEVVVMYDTENSHLTEEADAAGQLLLRDLQVSDGLAAKSKLDRFATNLHRLAKIDRLSSNQVNCFEALSGIHTSLNRLYLAQKKTASDLQVTCLHAGRPTMHANGRIGMAIEYWQQDRYIASRSPSDQPTDTDGDTANDSTYSSSRFTLGIGVESSHAGLYPSLRVSDHWLADPLDLATSDSGGSIPWQEPPSTTIIAGSDEVGSMAIDGSQKLPDLRFTATLDPPVVMPWQTASAIMQNCGLTGVQPFVHWPTWHSMLLGQALPLAASSANGPVATAEQTVLSVRDGEEAEVVHSYSLDIAKPEIAIRLEELPFSHPRQLVEALPILRQWACFGTCVKDAFSTYNFQAPSAQTVPDGRSTSLEDLLRSPPFEPLAQSLKKIPISIALVTSPTPTLDLVFAANGETTLQNFSVQVLPNAQITVLDHRGLGDSDSLLDDGCTKATELTHALEKCGDLGVWIEWIRNREGWTSSTN